jgi:hypothetical protein
VNGRSVAELVRGVRPAGEHSVRWDATGVRSGAYLCRIEASGADGASIRTTKILVVR